MRPGHSTITEVEGHLLTALKYYCMQKKRGFGAFGKYLFVGIIDFGWWVMVQAMELLQAPVLGLR